MKSILSEEKRCYVCGSTVNIENHHIFFGPLRPVSDRRGFKAFLCGFHHRDTKHGVHGNRELDLRLKRECQRKYEEKHTREEWMKIIGRNYL